MDVAALLQHRKAPALGAGVETAQHRPLVHVDARHLELVDVGALVVFGIGDRRLERLLDDPGALLGTERQDVQRLVDGLATDEIGDQPALLGGEPDATNRCTDNWRGNRKPGAWMRRRLLLGGSLASPRPFASQRSR